MRRQLPFPVTVRPWNELADNERCFFQFPDDYLPLAPARAAQIGCVELYDGRRIRRWAMANIPGDWGGNGEADFPHVTTIGVGDAWKDAEARAEVRQWLFRRRVPFRRIVYLMYDDLVVETTWGMVVRYWDAFAWSVGVAMIAVDHTLQWACCFDHEGFITFGGHSAADPNRLFRGEGRFPDGREVHNAGSGAEPTTRMPLS